MRKIIVSSALALFAVVLPAVTSAQTLFDTLGVFNAFLSGMIGIFVTLAIVVFFWGLIRYLVNAGEEKAEGLQLMFYGVIAIFVMVSIWGIIRLLQSTFQVSSNNPLVPKSIPLNAADHAARLGY